jgi:nucleoside-diphosphate-sugar epimerase
VEPPPPEVRFVRCSVADDAAREIVAAADFTAYIAGTTRDYARRPRETLETQMLALERCLDAAGTGSSFLFVSSARVYGRPQSPEPVTEDARAFVEPMHLDNLYDSAKRWGESLCRWYAERRGLGVAVVRMTHIYGPFATRPPETLVTDLVRQAVETRAIRLEDPGSTRNHCSVLDAVQGIVLALVSGESGRAYNVGSHEHLRLRDVADVVAAQLPFDVDVRAPASPVKPSVQRISIARAAMELGYEPAYRFEQLAPLVVDETARALAPAADG